MSFLQSTDLSSLCAIVAGKLRIPQRFAASEVVPQFVVDMATSFSAQYCRADYPTDDPHRGWSGPVLIHLYRKRHAVADVASDEWNRRLWGQGHYIEDTAVGFVLEQASKSLFAPFILAKLLTPVPGTRSADALQHGKQVVQGPRAWAVPKGIRFGTLDAALAGCRGGPMTLHVSDLARRDALARTNYRASMD